MTSPSRSAGKLSHVQALRAYAALAVVLFHVSARSGQLLHRQLAPRWLGWGSSGVDTFFVLSGFIIMTVHRRDISRPSELKPYLIKRAVRIYPIYWLVTLAVLPVYLAGYGYLTKRNTGVIIRSFTLFPQHVGVFPIVNVGWTLSYEVFFYLMFGLLIAAPLRLALLVIAAWLTPCLVVLTLSVAQVWNPSYNHLLWYFLFSPRNLEFALGAVVALVGPKITLPRPRRWLAGAFLLLVAGVAATTLTNTRIPYALLVIAAVPSGLMVLAAAQLDRMAIAAPRALEAVGDASYSLYLIHFGVITVVFEAARHLHIVNDVTWVPVLVLAGAAAVTAALVSYRFVETPLLRLGRRRLLSSR